MQLPIYSLTGEHVATQYRRPGKNPIYMPRGIKTSQCQPYIGRLEGNAGLLVCEGPTDAISASTLPSIGGYDIVGAWSASTLPPRSWWFPDGQLRSRTVVSCGDNDLAGAAFNQRIANIVGGCYPLVWPSSRPPKWDVCKEVESNENRLEALIALALARSPLVASVKQESKYERKQQSRPGLISTLIEAAGGRLAFQMEGQNRKYYCPLHDDRDDASLTADDSTGSFRCWAGCAQGGPVQWIMAWKGVDYKSALELMRRYT